MIDSVCQHSYSVYLGYECYDDSHDYYTILLSNMYGKISQVVKARITRVPQARVQYGALTTSDSLPYMFDNVFIICLCVKRNADSAVRCSSKSSVLV